MAKLKRLEESPVFGNKILPYFLVAPQLVVAGIFFLWPAALSLYQSLERVDPFGLHTRFVGLRNFASLFTEATYLYSMRISFFFSLIVAIAALFVGLVFAMAANRRIRGGYVLRTLLIWPYALAPAIAGVLWMFLFQPSIGIIPRFLSNFGVTWNYTLSGTQAFALICLVSIWQRLPYNFIFFLAALQAIPKELLEAAAVDGAKPNVIFRKIIFPLLSPTTFFLLVVNLAYGFFSTFGIVDAITQGGPANATTILSYGIYMDGFVHLRLGRAAAQSVILLVIGVVLTLLQFKFVEKRVHYQ